MLQYGILVTFSKIFALYFTYAFSVIRSQITDAFEVCRL